LHVERLGHSSTTASLGLALGVTGEIFIMLFAAPLLARLGPSRLILIAALTGPPRWALTAMSADPAVLVATQSLHALGFGAFWIGGTRLVSRQAPTALASTAQSLLTASGWGIGNLASMALAAVLLPTGGTPLVFLGSAVLSGAAVVAAAHLQTQQDPPPGRV
jgi:PPP family 3-phenylpropionic acid transporter